MLGRCGTHYLRRSSRRTMRSTGTASAMPRIGPSQATPGVVPPNITVDGNGSVLKTPANSTTLRSDDAIMQLSSGDTIRDFIFDGNVNSQGGVWTQHRHAIRIGTASDISISYNIFRNLIGDGIYLDGASSLTIDHNQFSGDHSNRNGISIISGNGNPYRASYF